MKCPCCGAAELIHDTRDVGVDENQVIHSALHDLAVKLLPQYEADDGHLTNVQLRQIKKSVLQGGLCSVRSRLGCG